MMHRLNFTQLMLSALVLLAILLAALPSCSRETAVGDYRENDRGRATGRTLRRSITIAEQYGLAYAPIQIMRLKGLLETRLPETDVHWIKLENTAAIREAIIAGRVDIGFGGIPPFLTGWDAGMEWKIVTGLSSLPVGLVSRDPTVRTLEDFRPESRIIVPQPGSIQHILLAMALEREFGSARLFDDLLVSMAHPDGMSAMLSDPSVTAHFTAPPYLFTELEQDGFSLVLTGRQAMGKSFTFIVGSATDRFLREFPIGCEAFLMAVEEAVDFIGKTPAAAAELLAPVYGLDADTLFSYLTAEEMVYSTAVEGVMDFAAFMHRHGYLKQMPASRADVVREYR